MYLYDLWEKIKLINHYVLLYLFYLEIVIKIILIYQLHFDIFFVIY